MKQARYTAPVLVFSIVFLLLVPVQLFAGNHMLMLDRFIQGGGWIEIPLVALYGAFVVYKMQDLQHQKRWRLITWSAFSILFFGQLILGISGLDKFLMTGKLHLPVPMVILGGPVYRGGISFMPLLFITTVVLSGPAWCSHLCYMGALDGIASNKGKGSRKGLANLRRIKFAILTLVIASALIFRSIGAGALAVTIAAALFGVTGLIIMLLVSTSRGRMMNCLAWCPIGTIVNYARFVNPFRLTINDSCTSCMRCIPECKYGALDRNNISLRTPGITCTLCGDCLNVCRPGSIQYRFPGLGPESSRMLFLVVTVSLHAVFMALARI